MRLPDATPLAPASPGAFRRWIRSDMLVLRWVFLALYVLLVGALAFQVLGEWHETFFIVAGVVLLISQALLIFGTGTIRLCHPIRKRRLILPILAAATMMTLLVLGFLAAMSELLELDNANFPGELVFFLLIGLSWIGWGVLLWHHVRGRSRHSVLSRLTTWIFAGSLAELLATVPSHLIVTRRPGCFVGMATMLGIIAGLAVMFASFGPMIFLLFLRPRYRAEVGADGHPYCPGCGYDLRASKDRCPECGLAVGGV